MRGHSLLLGIFLTQGLNPGLLQYRQIIYRLSHQGWRKEGKGKKKERRPPKFINTVSWKQNHICFHGLEHWFLKTVCLMLGIKEAFQVIRSIKSFERITFQTQLPYRPLLNALPAAFSSRTFLLLQALLPHLHFHSRTSPTLKRKSHEPPPRFIALGVKTKGRMKSTSC